MRSSAQHTKIRKDVDKAVQTTIDAILGDKQIEVKWIRIPQASTQYRGRSRNRAATEELSQKINRVQET